MIWFCFDYCSWIHRISLWHDRSTIIHFIIKYLVFQIYSLKSLPGLLGSNLHCARKTSSGLRESDFTSIKEETRCKLFLFFGSVWFFKLNGLEHTFLNRELHISIKFSKSLPLVENLQKTAKAFTVCSAT